MPNVSLNDDRNFKFLGLQKREWPEKTILLLTFVVLAGVWLVVLHVRRPEVKIVSILFSFVRAFFDFFRRGDWPENLEPLVATKRKIHKVIVVTVRIEQANFDLNRLKVKISVARPTSLPTAPVDRVWVGWVMRQS